MSKVDFHNNLVKLATVVDSLVESYGLGFSYLIDSISYTYGQVVWLVGKNSLNQSFQIKVYPTGTVSAIYPDGGTLVERCIVQGSYGSPIAKQFKLIDYWSNGRIKEYEI